MRWIYKEFSLSESAIGWAANNSVCLSRCCTSARNYLRHAASQRQRALLGSKRSLIHSSPINTNWVWNFAGVTHLCVLTAISRKERAAVSHITSFERTVASLDQTFISLFYICDYKLMFREALVCFISMMRSFHLTTPFFFAWAACCI